MRMYKSHFLISLILIFTFWIDESQTVSLTTKTSEKSLRGNVEKTSFLDISSPDEEELERMKKEAEEVIDEEEEEEESGYSSDDVFAAAKHLEEVAESLERSLRDSAESASRIIKEDLERKIDATRKAREEAETNVDLHVMRLIVRRRC